MATKKQQGKKAATTKPAKAIRTTQAECENRDPIGNTPFFAMPVCQPEPPEVEEIAPDLPRYQNGCPECGEHSLVTEQKIHAWRVCHCRECEWRGEMED